MRKLKDEPIEIGLFDTNTPMGIAKEVLRHQILSYDFHFKKGTYDDYAPYLREQRVRWIADLREAIKVLEDYEKNEQQ